MPLSSRIKHLERALSQELKRLSARSCTFYVRDPYWVEEFRLVCMPGITLPEPMHGFVFPDKAKEFISQGENEWFCNQPVLAQKRLGDSVVLPVGVPRARRLLFCDFAEREGIKSFARFLEKGKLGEVKAVLFVNYDRSISFSDDVKTQLRKTMLRACENLHEVTTELRRVDAEHLAETVRILRPAQALVRSIARDSEHPLQLKSYFERILKSSLEAMQIAESEGLGTVHLYNKAQETLELTAWCGNAPRISKAERQIAGEGVISWVALRQRSVLISDLENSRFREMRVAINQDVRSELAVPMIADGELLGVLNLECTRKGAFHPASVRSVWYAANNAAVACQLATSARVTRTLLAICEAATRDDGGPSNALNQIAGVFSQFLGAESCDIWHYNSSIERFDAAGATYEPFDPKLRADGWNHYVAKTKHPVWLSNIKSMESFTAEFWNSTDWQKSASDSIVTPKSVNEKLVELGVKAALGIPIVVAGECVGVAWTAHRHDRKSPTVEHMNHAFSIASQTGLVLELTQRQLERPDRIQLKTIGEQLREFSTSCSLDFHGLPIEGYVVHRSLHPHACGDFHITSAVDSSTAGLLIGDGTGKAVSGLLNALPLIIGFQECEGSGSTRYVIDKLRTRSNRLGLSGTALYWTFTKIAGEIWISMASAGHPRPVWVQTGVGAWVFPNDKFSRAVGTPLGLNLESPQTEFLAKLDPGTLLVAYTDGITDALSKSFRETSDKISELAAEKVIELAVREQHSTCRRVAETIMAAAEEAENPLKDDATVCVVRYSP